MNKIYIIAEIGVNHNGDYNLALKLIDAAVNAGANAVKFQTFCADSLVTKTAPLAQYQQRNLSQQYSQYEMLRKLELTHAEQADLQHYCKSCEIDFISTPFDLAGAAYLCEKLRLKVIKIGSGDIDNAPLLFNVARRGCDVILSSGMSSLVEIEQALATLALGYMQHKTISKLTKTLQYEALQQGQTLLEQHVKVLHCTSQYPADFSNVNLKALELLRQAFKLPVGLSDHTPGSAVAIAAVAFGAQVIEKHITLDRNMPGPDHLASIEVAEFKTMVQGIRQVELALGDGRKLPCQAELLNMQSARKSLVADIAIKQGEIFNPDNISCKRPGSGISPRRYWDYLGKVAHRDYAAGDLLDEY